MDDLIGKTLSGYQIIEQIGKGGMATVYRAYQPSLDRDVAIKVLPPYYADQDETFIARFKREARAIAKLRHPNILMVMDFGQEENLSYIVMEYVDAGTLKERMRTAMTLKEIHTLLGQIASALDYAHEQGVVHRDIKPSNILLPKPDWALLTDFGLARMVGGSFMTQSGLTVGTPAYMSPEQGSGSQVDHRTDIYSLGVMLYELVVGEVPYTAETPMAVVVKHIVDPLPLPRDKNPKVPERLQQVILKALAKNPADRFQKAGDIITAMAPIVNEDPDWSAARMRVVDAVREPVVDTPSTKVLNEAELAEAAEAPTLKENPISQPVSSPVSTPAKPKRPVWAFVLGGFALLALCGVVGVLAVNAFKPQISQWLNPPPENTPAAQQPPDDSLGLPDFPTDGQDQAQPPDGQTGTLFDDGLGILDRGDLNRALDIFRRALSENPQLWGEFFGLVLQRYEEGDYDAAIRLFQVGMEARPNAPINDQEHFGWLLLDAGRDQAAYEIFIGIIEQDPSHSPAYDGLSNAAFYLGREREALDYLLGLTERFPNQPLLLAAIADMFYWLEEYQNSIDYYERAFEMHPDDPWMYILSVDVYITVEQYDRAVEMIETAVEMAPNDSEIADMAASGYMAMGMDQAALEAFRRALELNPENGWAHVGLAELLIYLEQDLARVPQHLETAERIGREFPDYWLLESVAWGWVDYGNCGRALAIFELIDQEAGDMIDVGEGLDYCR